MRRRTRARGRALQALYAWEARGFEGDPEAVADELSGGDAFVRELVRAVGDHRAEIDQRIVEVMPNWRLERLSAVDRNILRLATAEMMYGPETPAAVCIQEALRLADRFGGLESARFVNGVLDAIWKRLHAPEAGPAG
ncbi:MAG: transcription antitermination factor NusB [Gemmatimonadetes bacterium]|nr:transcription antitermination factor NusB [Gemmatimonadota bacterium]